MDHLNLELYQQRMMGGALRGAAPEEISDMARRCKAKLENGKRCHVVPLPGHDMCMSCEKRGAELYDVTTKAAKPFRAHDLETELGKKKPGRPAKKGAVSEAEQELQQAGTPDGTERPKALCDTCEGNGICDGSMLSESPTACTAFQPVGGETPERRLTDEAQAERDQFESTYGRGGNCSCHISPPCSSCLHPGNPANQEEDDSCWTTEPVSNAEELPENITAAWTRDEERTQGLLLQIGIDTSIGLLQRLTDEQLQAAEASANAVCQRTGDFNDDGVPTIPSFLKGLQTAIPGQEQSKAKASGLDILEERNPFFTRLPGASFEIPSVDHMLPISVVDPYTESKSPAKEARRGISALLRAPSEPPAPPVGLFIPFAPEELFILEESEVTPEIIREFVIMGLEGKVGLLPEVSDDGR